MDFEPSYITQPTSIGTRLTSTIEMQPVVLTGMEEASLAESLRRDARANLIDLKELLETRGIAASPGTSADRPAASSG